MLAPIRKTVIAAALSAAVVADARSVKSISEQHNAAAAVAGANSATVTSVLSAGAAAAAIQAEHATALKYEKKVNLLASALAKEVRNMGLAQKEISSAKKELAALKQAKAEMEAKSQQRESALLQQQDAAKAQLAQQQQKEELLEKNVRDKVSEMQIDLEANGARATKAENDKHDLDAKLEQAKKQISAKSADNDLLKKQNQSATAQLKEKQLEVDWEKKAGVSAEASVKQAEKAAANSEKKIHDALLAAAEKVDGSWERADAAEKKTEELKKQVASMKKAISSATESLKAEKRERETAEDVAKEAKKQMESDEAKVKNLHEQLTKVSGSEGAELKEIQEKYAAVRNKLGKVEDEEDKMDETLEAEKKKSASLLAENGKLSKANRANSEEITGLQSQLSNAGVLKKEVSAEEQKGSDELRKEIVELKKRMAQQDRLLKSSSSIDNEMKAKLEAAQQKVSEDEEKIAKYEGTTSSSTDGSSSDSSTDDSSDNSKTQKKVGLIDQLREEIKEVKQHGSFYFDENLQLHQENDQLKSENESDTKQIEQLKSKNEQLKTEAEHERQVARKSQESVYTALATTNPGLGMGAEIASDRKGHFSALSPTFRQAFMDFDNDDDDSAKKKKEVQKTAEDEVKDIEQLAKNAPASVKAQGAKAKMNVVKAAKVKDNKTSGKAALVKSTTTHRQIKAPKNVLELVSASRSMFRAIKAHAAKGVKKH